MVVILGLPDIWNLPRIFRLNHLEFHPDFEGEVL
jgi:hypothetical protein